MDITKSNFNEVFPKVKQAIEECDFLAMDTELTGLATERRNHAFDTMEERYWKTREYSKGFLIIQFGISCFRYHEDSKKYTHKDFNFYVFPRPHVHQAPDPVFICQPSSINFLIQHGFDFNKMFSEGISYLKPHDEQRLKSMLKTKHEEQVVAKAHPKSGTPKSQRTVHIPDDQAKFLKDIQTKIKAFISKDEEETLDLPPCSGYQRKLIYQVMERDQKIFNGLYLKTCQNDSHLSYINVTKVSEKAKLEKLELKRVAEVEDLEDAVGLRKVLDLISESQKLVLGHNMLLDTIHVIHQFFYSLPDNLLEFKDLVKCLFPRLLDTKTLASALVFKDIISSTTLGDLFLELKKDKYKGNIESKAAEDCYDMEMVKMHEAGFDAFMTGYVFIKLATMLETTQEFVTPRSEVLNSYINRPYIMGHFDVRSLNLRGPDPEPKRDHVFYVSFPKEWKTFDLVELFSPYGGIYISWLSDTCAFIALRAPEQSINVKRVFAKDFSNLYRVKTFAEYQETQAQFPYRTPGKNHGDSEPPASKRRRSSLEGSVSNRKIDTIPEEDEVENNSTGKQENLVSTSHDPSSEKTKASFIESPKPKAKKQKIVHEDGEANEVTSTEKLFEEPSW